jgi:hypothetical protein
MAGTGQGANKRNVRRRRALPEKRAALEDGSLASLDPATSNLTAIPNITEVNNLAALA